MPYYSLKQYLRFKLLMCGNEKNTSDPSDLLLGHKGALVSFLLSFDCYIITLPHLLDKKFYMALIYT